MTELILFLKDNLAEHFVIYFIPLYYLGGRPIALISAQLIGHKISFLLPVAVLLDTLQIPIFYHLYGSISNSAMIRKLSVRRKQKEAKRQKTRLFQWVQTWGTPGVIVITILPLKGCGMLSGFILSKLLQLPKTRVYLLLILGSIVGCGILFGLGEVILKSWEFVTKKY
ncbi:MAG: small multi-drug export protein [Deltaproteobacteria bacterium]|nr:small multi-drug export protein [Deltaproteobacteria bacterium]